MYIFDIIWLFDVVYLYTFIDLYRLENDAYINFGGISDLKTGCGNDESRRHNLRLAYGNGSRIGKASPACVDKKKLWLKIVDWKVSVFTGL